MGNTSPVRTVWWWFLGQSLFSVPRRVPMVVRLYWSVLPCDHGYFVIVLSCQLVCLCYTVEWTWWPCRAHRLEIYFFSFKVTWAKSIFFRFSKIGNCTLDHVIQSYSSWKPKKSSETTTTLAYYTGRRILGLLGLILVRLNIRSNKHMCLSVYPSVCMSFPTQNTQKIYMVSLFNI